MTMLQTTDRRAVVAQDAPSFGAQLAQKAAAFRQMLPDGIDEKKFSRVVMTAVQRNPELAEADRQSLWNACVQAAGDGLIPDGREGALVVFKGKVQFLPMVAGIKKRVRQSGEIATWDAYVVHKKDDFDFALGDEPFIRHKPFMDGDPGPIIAAYSVVTLKTGEKSREVMTKAQLDQVKRASRSSGTGPWKDWESEMCRKTVVKRHAKSLPMSTEVRDLIDRDNNFAAVELVAPTHRVISDPLSDDAPAPDWRGELDLYAGDLGDCGDLRALDETIGREGARFSDAPPDIQAEARKIEAAERARVEPVK